ncbi:MAG: GNAT family N-acetyltransferase [Vicingaceae bacterium]
MKSTFPLLESKRLLLRQAQAKDWSQLAYLRSDKEVNEFVNRPAANGKKEAMAFIEQLHLDFQAAKMFYWVICLKEKDEMIGSICLWHFSVDEKNAEIGCDLHPTFQGKGFMTEAMNRIIDFGFSTLSLTSIEAYTHRHNQASTQLLKRTDFLLVEGKTDPDNTNNVVFVRKS